MSNFSSSKNFGTTTGGTNLTEGEQAVLAELYVTQSPDRLVTRLPFVTTEDSIYLGGILSISSGNDAVFFKNYETNIDMYPLWGGIKDQSLLENQGPEGIIQPFGRVLSDTLVSTSLTGGAETDPITYRPRIGNFILPSDMSVYGIEFRHEDQIGAGTELTLSLHVGEDNTGLVVYRDRKMIVELSTGSSVIDWWFRHPLEARQGTTYFLEISFSSDSGRVLSVSEDTEGLAYVRAHLRPFEDKEVAFTDNHSHTGLTAFEDVVIGGDFTVNGTATTINTVTLEILDKNIELGVADTPTDLTADGGGITLKGSTDKTILWDGGSETWDFNQNVHVEGDLSTTGTFVGNGSGITDIDHDMHLPLGGTTSGSNGDTGNFGWTSLGTFPPLDTSNSPPLGFISRGSPLRLILDLGSDQKLSGMLYQNYVLTSGAESERGLRGVTVYSSTAAPSTGWNEVLGDLTTQFVGDLERETEAPHLSPLKLVPFASGTVGRYIIIDSSNQVLSSWGATWKGMRAMLAQVADSPLYESQLTTLVADSLSNVGDLSVNSLTTVQSVVVGTELVVGGNVSVGGMIQSGDGLNTGIGTNALASIRVDLGGFNNTAIGSNAAFILTTGTNNIIIGANAQPTTPTISNQIVIGTPTQTQCIIHGAIQGNGENLTNISCSAVVREQGYLRLSAPHLLQQQGALGGSWVTSSYTDSPTDTAGTIASRGFNLLVGKTYELTCHLHGIGGFQDWLTAYWVKEGETTPCGWATKGGIQFEQSSNSGFTSITGPITTTVTPSATSRYHIWVSTTSGFIDLYSQGAAGSECTMHVKEV